MIDILVVGGGTAGLTAGLYGVRAGKTVKVLEQKNYGGQIINSKEIVNYPGISKSQDMNLLPFLYRQATDAGVDFALGKVKSIRDLGKVKEVVAEIQGEEKVYEAKAVILAAGAKTGNWDCRMRKNLPVPVFPIVLPVTECFSETGM